MNRYLHSTGTFSNDSSEMEELCHEDFLGQPVTEAGYFQYQHISIDCRERQATKSWADAGLEVKDHQ